MNLRKKLPILHTLFALFIMLSFVQYALAVTVYPGTHIANPAENYTANVHPNFNVTQIITNSSHVFLGVPYYDFVWPSHSQINANITGFNENKNATFLITSTGTSGVTMNILGHVQQVKLNNVQQPFGSTWNYGTCGTLSCTIITVGSTTNIFISWGGGSISTTNFILSGYVLSGSGIFNQPTITLTSPASANVTALLLFNNNGALVSFESLGTPFGLIANSPTSIPISLQDNTNPTGGQTYYEQAIIQTSTSTTVVTSNLVTLQYGTFTNGNFQFNLTNTNTVPIYFIRKDLNSTDTRLSVIYPKTYNMDCNFGYTFAMINKTYGPPLPNVPFDTNNDNSSFHFHNIQNEIINVICTDTLSNTTGKYVLTQSSLPFQQQITDFRHGKYGTNGQFGIYDFTTLIVIIISMIGFNRKTESVGAFFCIGIIGAAAVFQIITFPTFIFGAVIVIGLLSYTSTRKKEDYT